MNLNELLSKIRNGGAWVFMEGYDGQKSAVEKLIEVDGKLVEVRLDSSFLNNSWDAGIFIYPNSEVVFLEGEENFYINFKSQPILEETLAKDYLVDDGYCMTSSPRGIEHKIIKKKVSEEYKKYLLMSPFLSETEYKMFNDFRGADALPRLSVIHAEKALEIDELLDRVDNIISI